MNQPPDYFRYWGKAEKDGQGYHLLVYASTLRPILILSCFTKW